MKRTIWGCMILTLVVMPAALQASDWTGNVNGFLGAKILNKGDWEPAENHYEFGVRGDAKKVNWPICVALEVLYSKGDGTIPENMADPEIDVEGRTIELGAGVRKIWDGHATLRPYIGGGPAVIFARALGETRFGDTASDSDEGFGFWISGGIYWTLGSSFNIGVDLRYSYAEATLHQEKGETGGGHAGLILGYHW